MTIQTHAPASLRDVVVNQLLPVVEKPSRYLGSEYNATHKDPATVDLRVALIFPDLYDLGLGNLGLLILYNILNAMPRVWAERAYTPAPDMEKALRDRGLPLFTNESKTGLGELDLLGFTLQSELTYTNILNIIDLAGIPLRTEVRSEDHPLLCAGGPSVFNPEPLAPFMDFFVIGDGEDVIVEIAESMLATKGQPRRERLEALARLEGVYVPALYPFEQMPDGRILPKQDAPKIVRRIVRDLNQAKFPSDYLVPYTQQVHDRAGLEVLRGCTQGCRFCQAGMVTRPVRERTVEEIDRLMEETLSKTGYEEVSLVSLSTCDYSRVRTMVQQAANRAAQSNVSVSLPSLRLDSFAVELADMVADVRRSGLTFAPEAASPRLRAVINKWIPDEDLLEMAAQAYRRGWQHVKTYFMIGLPTERDDDLDAIVDLCARTLAVGRAITPRSRVNTGVSTFVPKPFTPFQWAEQIDLDESKRRQALLDAGFRRHSGIKFGKHMPEATFIEGLITRGDRRAGDLIEAAWRRGARLESWDEHVHFEYWQEAIEELGYDVQGVFRQRDLDERLPWDHIDTLIPKKWLQDEWNRAMVLEHAQDCRHSKCHKCGVIDRERPLCAHMLRGSIHGRKEETDWQPSPVPRPSEPEPAQRLRFRIGRVGEVRFLSHLELVSAWVRALRRAGAPMSYSQGFHQHPKVQFATAPPVGEESLGDYMDVTLRERAVPEELLNRLSDVLPTGFRVFAVEEVPLKAPSLMSLTAGFRYRLGTNLDPATLELRVTEVLDAQELTVERNAKQRSKGRRNRRTVHVDIRPMIARADVTPNPDTGRADLLLDVRMVENRGARLREVLEVLGLNAAETKVVKEDTVFAE